MGGTGARTETRPLPVGPLLAVPWVLFAGQETAERALAGHGAAEALRPPAVRLGLGAQVLVALALAVLLRSAGFTGAVARYVSFLMFEGQVSLSAASDPFRRAWDLFGTADGAVDFAVVSTTTIAWVQVLAIVTGHVAAMVPAHDRALAVFTPGAATKSQYPLLAAIVLFTVGGLTLLISG